MKLDKNAILLIHIWKRNSEKYYSWLKMDLEELGEEIFFVYTM